MTAKSDSLQSTCGSRDEIAAHLVIVGAGPAGATLSYLLVRCGIRVMLLERQVDFAKG
ncbi:MAG: FAD-dependent monooxygenase [Candidatus Binataceae bacterium]